MLMLGIVIAMAATGLGLWALVLAVRANPSVRIPVFTGRVAVDPPRARGIQAGMAGLTVMAGTLAAAEIGMVALWLVVRPLLLPLLAALGYNVRLSRGARRRAE